MVYEEKDEMFGIGVERSRSRGYIFLSSASHTTSEVRYIPADKPADAFRLMLPRETGHEYYADHHGDEFYIRTNEKGARNFKLVSAPVSDAAAARTGKRSSRTAPGVMLERRRVVQRLLRRHRARQRDAASCASSTTRRQGDRHPGARARLLHLAEHQPRVRHAKVRYSYQSFITPASVYDYDVKTGKSELLKQQPVLGGYDPTLYKSERVYATASDGTKVPVSLVYKKDVEARRLAPAAASAPTARTASRRTSASTRTASRCSTAASSSPSRTSAAAATSARSGTTPGKMMTKKNTFTDFIAAAEHLVKAEVHVAGAPRHHGRLGGRAADGRGRQHAPRPVQGRRRLRPLRRCRQHELDETLPLTAGEWEEWGNPVKSKENFQYMLSYSPYDNVAAKAYPAMLVKTSLNDSQVLFHEPTKWVAKLRAVKTDKNPLLAQGQHGRRPRRRFGALRRAARSRLRLRIHPHPDGHQRVTRPRGGADAARRPRFFVDRRRARF